MRGKELMRRSIIVTLFIALALSAAQAGFAAGNSDKSMHPVVFVHGGAIDDYVSYLLLTTMDNIDLRAVIVTNTDSIPRYAMQAQWKIQKFIKDDEVSVGLSRARGWNPFPWPYRSDSIRQHDVEALANSKDNPNWPPFPSGDDLLKDILSRAVKKNSPVTVLITCPLTTVSDLLRKHPELKKGIDRLIWIGGAVKVAGNLDKNTIPAEVANPEAEWNIFFDPRGSEWLFENTSFPIILFPLDVTDQARLTTDFKEKLAAQASRFRYSRLVSQGYGLTKNEPFYEMWNTVTTTYLAHPEFFEKPKKMKLKIVTEGFSQGAIRQSPSGRSVHVVFNIAKKKQFYNYILEQFKRDSLL